MNRQAHRIAVVFRGALTGVLVGALIGSTTGCSASQAKVNTVVQDIANWTPTVSADATTLLREIAAFEPADAATIQKAVTVMQADAAQLTSLCQQYLAAPGATLLAQIGAMVGEMVTADSGALLAVAGIKNPQSLETAQAILALIATGLTIASGWLQSINVQPTANVASSLELLRPYADRATLALALARAQDQDLAPRQATLATFGF